MEIGSLADTRYDDKYGTKIQRHKFVCQRKCKNCTCNSSFWQRKDVSSVALKMLRQHLGPQQVALAREALTTDDHALTSLSKRRSKEILGIPVPMHKTSHQIGNDVPKRSAPLELYLGGGRAWR